MNFAYRVLRPKTGLVIFLTHLAAVLDNWDPRVVDGIAARPRVITFDNRGVGDRDHEIATSYGAAHLQDPKQFLSFTMTPEGRRAGSAETDEAARDETEHCPANK